MKPQGGKTVKTYLEHADTWARDSQDELRRSRRVAWILVGVLACVSICQAIAILFLFPLKTVVPYTLMVDRQTGSVQLLKPLDPGLVPADAALTQSFLVQYVIARQGFDYDTVQNDYRRVASWSVGVARASYIASMPASNPESPLARYPRGTAVDVRVKSVSSIGDHVALVRFDTLRHDAGQQPTEAMPYVAVVRYTFANRPMSTEERYLNPLGFEVVRYRVTPEALTPIDERAPAITPAPRVTSPSAPAPTLTPGSRSRFADRPVAAPLR